ncbi:PQQ-dependent sugar dehydrogenase [Candidatus Laterigemmans baculatus]|uniref:PQQ-dependent sugar dehydrogenase n=1 Tax=Candidatus Laterigemmans baculatus TaxID=2770505 RepID=UPI0013DCC639|nr:PQQ-dependent sugar dehydrogenase [Candidatus Laterigemmans baculatus]
MRLLPRVLLLITVVALPLPLHPATARGEEPNSPQLKIPDKFVPVDTSRLMGSPDPLPLRSVAAFPQLQFERPVELTHAGDGSNRLFVVEQQGVIRVFENRSESSQTKVFLDLRDVVSRDGNEEGLLGLAFHPEYEQNGEFFVYYSTRPRASVISRFRVSEDDPERAVRDSEEELLRIDQPYSNHNGGSIRFGPDGYLYVGLGDGGLANDPHANGQNLRTLLGSILRIDIDSKDEGLSYAIPPDNPFVGREDARGEIWAYGVRNIWRLAFDAETGELWAGDVGQNRFEEIDRITRGGNYGWNIREGFHDFNPNAADRPEDLIDPVVEYFREEGQSVTGGMVYRGPQLEEYRGAYFYADYLSGKVWALWHEEGELREHRQVAETGLQIAAFGADQQGEMYLCTFEGTIHKLRPREEDLRKIAKAFPRTLSETGLFASVADNRPAAGLIPYELNMPFWSDYAVKDRYIALPSKQSVVFHEEEKWEFPVGTVFVKTFWLHRDRSDPTDLRDPLRLETRLLVHAPQGWTAYTYVYDDDQQEAHLLDGSLLKPIEVKTADGEISQPYYFPSRSECFACHTQAEGFVLGLTTRQMNRPLRYHGESENQLQLLARLAAFSEKIPEPPAEQPRFPDWHFGNLDRNPEDERTESVLTPPEGDPQTLARAWLETNCAMCHRPEGIAAHRRDLRFTTPLAEMKLVGQKPSEGQLGPPGTLLVKPGEAWQSELHFRIGRRGPRQMPPLATNLVDPRGLAAVREWIEQMQPPQAGAEGSK